MNKILVVHGDKDLRTTLGAVLEQENFIPIWAADSETGLSRAQSHNPQLLILDLPLRGTSGLEFCRQIRASRIRTPMIVLSPGDDALDRILMLEMGADDCIMKPFTPRELLARMRAVLRRTASSDQRTIRFGNVEIDPERRVITSRGKEVKVTPCEYSLLMYFVHNGDRALTRDTILNSVWGYDPYLNTRVVDAHVVKLRSKLEPDPTVPRHILTIHGVGYRFLM